MGLGYGLRAGSKSDLSDFDTSFHHSRFFFRRGGGFVISALWIPRTPAKPGFGLPACYREIGMRKADIAKRMARAAKVSSGEAADRLDRAVRDILSNLRQGKETGIAGVGPFHPRRRRTGGFPARSRRSA